MRNLLLAYNNRANNATLAGGSYAVAMPLNNVKDSDIDLKARTTDDALASTRFTADIGAAKVGQVVALVNHNLSTAALWRVRHSAAALDFATPPGAGIYDSGWIAAKQLTFYGDAPANWGAQYAVVLLFDSAAFRYVTVEIDDTANADGYVDIGRLFIGGGLVGLRPSYPGFADYREDMSTVVTAPHTGKRFGIPGRRLRCVRFALPWLTQAEAAHIQEMQAEIGVLDEVLYAPDFVDADYLQRYSFLGSLKTLGASEWPNFGERSVPFEIKEI